MKNLRRTVLLGSAALFAAFLLCSGAAFGQSQPAAQPAPEPVTAALSPAMDALLRARKTVDKYFQQAANVVCTENVTQAMVGKNGKANYREESVFDYQLQADTNSGSLKLVETRDTRKAAFRDSARTLLITNGFTSMLLIIHPSYEASYAFEPAGEETVDGVVLAKINFKPIPGASSPAAFQLRGQSYPMPLSGTIWIEEQTGAVSKLIASVDTSLSDLGLQGMRSEIHYATVHFHDPDESYWMPISAVIDVETPRQHWRNIHRFAGYKRFRATIQVEEAEKRP
jgi:hypothetical protein